MKLKNILNTLSSNAKIYIDKKLSDNVRPTIGATEYADGYGGLVPTPKTTDRNKALFGDGKYHTIYNNEHGATILVTTTESVLYGRTVTLTDGITTLSGTLDSNGEATFTNVALYGTITVSSEDNEGNVAKKSVNITYFGTYLVNLSLNFSTVIINSTDPDMIGLVGTISKGPVEIDSVTMRLVAPSLAESSAEFYVEELGAYTVEFKTTGNGVCKRTVTVAGMKERYVINASLYHIYAFCIDGGDSNPDTNISYYDSAWGCENLDYEPAYMDFANDTFNMGSWTGNEFFFPRKCMLRSNGTVDYYFDRANDSLKESGEESTAHKDSAYDGNCMVEFPTVYFNRWQSGDKSYCVISNKKITEDFHAYAHHDINGNVLPYIYISAYDGSYINGKLRSIANVPANTANATTSGRICSYATRQQEINYAVANNSGGQGEQWYTWHKADWNMIIDYMFLLGRCADLQKTFGRGRDSGYVSAQNTGMVTTGSMDGKGMFWGENAGTAGVKAFFVENPYANIWKAVAGYINDRGAQKVKMTYGQEDGSTSNGFNVNGTGYVAISDATTSGTNGGFISKWLYGPQGYVPCQASGSQTTYIPDGMWFNNDQANYAVVGGTPANALACGAAVSMGIAASVIGWNVGALLSYKGLVS